MLHRAFADWAKALIPRCVTGSLAIDVATAIGIGSHTECAGLAAMLQAVMTVALGSSLLKLVLGSPQKPAGNTAGAAGVAAGCTAGAVGVAALADGQPAAVANGMLAYAVMGLLSSLLVSVPAVQQALLTAVAAAV